MRSRLWLFFGLYENMPSCTSLCPPGSPILLPKNKMIALRACFKMINAIAKSNHFKTFNAPQGLPTAWGLMPQTPIFKVNISGAARTRLLLARRKSKLKTKGSSWPSLTGEGIKSYLRSFKTILEPVALSKGLDAETGITGITTRPGLSTKVISRK